MTQIEKYDYWQQIFEQQAQSGLSKTDYCRREGICLSTFHRWAKALREQGMPKSQTVIPVQISPTVAAEPLVLTLPNGYQLAFPETLEPGRLQQFVKAVAW